MSNDKAFSALLIDDDPNMHIMLELVAEHDHFALRHAVSAEEAMTCLKSFEPDIVIIDLFMAEIDGYQTLYMLRKAQHNPNCRFVATTAYHTSSTASEVMKSGFDAYLKKPLYLPGFGDSLSQLISG
jgi:CheY-like chemotaxis protein